MEIGSKQKTEDQFFDQWVQTEIWFMRGVGICLLLLAALSTAFGLFNASEELVADLVVRGLNGLSVFLMIGAGVWALLFSMREVQMVQLVETAMQRDPRRAYVIGGVQATFGVLMAFSGLRDSLPMLILGLLVAVAGGWFVYRGFRTREYQALAS